LNSHLEAGVLDDAEDAELGAVARVLASGRDAILTAWLRAATEQPFHQARPDAAVADDIPLLFDALVARLARSARPGDRPANVLSDDAIRTAASRHATVRAEQGLVPQDVAVEFRMLRQAVSRHLARAISDDLPAGDVVIALAVVSDGIDAAVTLALVALGDRIEGIREELLAITLHDLRQPVTVAMASLELAVGRLALDTAASADPVATDLLGDAHAATREIAAYVETMSDASRVATGLSELDSVPIRVRSLVESAVTIGGGDATRIDVVVAADDDTAGAIVSGDETLLRRAVVNMVTNALKYSPGRSRVTVHVIASDAWVEVGVQDAGIGMTPAEIAQAFTRYRRSDRVRQLRIAGLGLGLYAAQGIARAHGGDLVLTSDGPDLGTLATLRLPRVRADDPTDDPDALLNQA